MVVHLKTLFAGSLCVGVLPLMAGCVPAQGPGAMSAPPFFAPAPAGMYAAPPSYSPMSDRENIGRGSGGSRGGSSGGMSSGGGGGSPGGGGGSPGGGGGWGG